MNKIVFQIRAGALFFQQNNNNCVLLCTSFCGAKTRPTRSCLQNKKTNKGHIHIQNIHVKIYTATLRAHIDPVEYFIKVVVHILYWKGGMGACSHPSLYKIIEILQNCRIYAGRIFLY